VGGLHFPAIAAISFQSVTLATYFPVNCVYAVFLRALHNNRGVSRPGEALIFALEGRAVIGYEGEEFPIQAGENFKFAKLGRHWVKADGRFKMALLLTLEQ